MKEREAYIALNMMERVGPVTVRALVACLGSAESILTVPEQELLRAPGVGVETAKAIVRQRDAIDVEAELAWADELDARIISQVDAEYPKRLLEIHDPPLVLYVKGELELRDGQGVAIVGTRHATHYGLDCAQRLGYELGRAGISVLSGLAVGIDTAAHRGALKGGGRTVAVLGSALSNVYPAVNAELAESIAEQGAVLSELPLARSADRTTFPMRNRIVSGLSVGVVVVEAGRKSGALITSDQAAEQGRTVFAVPGRIDSPASSGTNWLLKQGARVVTGVDDILDELGQLFPGSRMMSESVKPLAVKLSEEEVRVVAELERGVSDVDELVRGLGLGAAKVGSILVGLEMRRVVNLLPGRQVELNNLGKREGNRDGKEAGSC